MPKYNFTPDDCVKWQQDRSRNPQTGRKIDPAAPRGVYQQLEKACNKQTKVSKTSDNPQDKYCRCLMHVRPKSGNPYGICTASVLKRYNAKRPPFCDYNLEDYETAELLAYGKEFETRKSYTFRLSPKAHSGDRPALLKELAALQKFLAQRAANKQ